MSKRVITNLAVSTRLRAFTLVEVLVVITIIGVLVATLLPAIGRAKYQARTTLEMSQLRQLALGWASVASDNSGRLPRRQQQHSLYGKIGGLESGGFSYRLFALKGAVKYTYTDRSRYIIQPVDAATAYGFDAATANPFNPRPITWRRQYDAATGNANLYGDWGIVAGFKEDTGCGASGTFTRSPPVLYAEGRPDDVLIQGMATTFNVPSWGDYNQLYGWHPTQAALGAGPLPGYYEVSATVSNVGKFLEGEVASFYDCSVKWIPGNQLVFKKYNSWTGPVYSGNIGLPPAAAAW